MVRVAGLSELAARAGGVGLARAVGFASLVHEARMTRPLGCGCRRLAGAGPGGRGECRAHRSLRVYGDDRRPAAGTDRIASDIWKALKRCPVAKLASMPARNTNAGAHREGCTMPARISG